MDSAVDRRNADETAAMLQLDPSDNLLWRPVVLQDADLDVGVQRCMLKALMRMTGFPALLVECLCSQWAISVMDLPSARKKSIFSRSNGVRCV